MPPTTETHKNKKDEDILPPGLVDDILDDGSFNADSAEDFDTGDPDDLDDGTDTGNGNNDDAAIDMRPEDGLEEQPEERHRRGRPRRKKTGRHDQMPTDPERRSRLAELGALELDDWVSAFDWQLPRMRFLLRRLSPPWYQGVKTAGHLDSKEGSGYKMAEVKALFGGGEYEAIISGPRHANDPRPTTLSKKRFSIAGDPIINQDSIPDAARYASPGPRGGGLGGRPPDPMKGLLDIVGGEVQTLRKRAYEEDKTSMNALSQMRNTYTDAMEVVQHSAEARATAREAAADERAKMAQQYAEKERREREEAQKRLLDMEHEMAEKIKNSQGDSFGLIATLLPSLTTSTQDQVRVIAEKFEAREARMSAEHAATIQQLNQMNQMQMQALHNNHEAQLKNVQTGYDNNATLLKAQIQNLQAEKDLLSRQLEDARRVLEDTRKEMMTHVTNAKQPKNSLEQLTEMGQLLEAMEGLKGVFGGGNSGGDLGDGLDDNPIAKNVLRLADKVATHIPAIAEAFSASKQQQQPVYPQQVAQLPTPYQQQGYQQHHQMPDAALQRRPRPAPQPQPAPQPPKVKLHKEDLRPALTFINAVLQSNPGNPPAPEELASAAMNQSDNAILRELARRNPDKVIAQLAEAGMLTGNLAEPQAREYLKQILLALKTKLV